MTRIALIAALFLMVPMTSSAQTSSTFELPDFELPDFELPSLEDLREAGERINENLPEPEDIREGLCPQGPGNCEIVTGPGPGPAPGPVGAIPEPTGALTFALGLGLLARVCRRR